MRKRWCLGFGFYWTWVYLSFNSGQIIDQTLDGISLIPFLHVASGLAGCVAFVIAIIWHRRIGASRHRGALLWTMAALTSLCSVFFVVGDMTSFVVCAIVSGLSSVWIALAWGGVFSLLDPREASLFTAGSFLLAGVLYFIIASIPQPLSGSIVVAMPLLSALTLFLAVPGTGLFPQAEGGKKLSKELGELLKGAFSFKVIVGLFMTMFVCGGLRAFSSSITSNVFMEPVIVALPTAAVALAFLVYSLFLKRTSINLGPLYRIAMPLFAIASVVLAVFGTDNVLVAYLIVSGGAAVIDMLTWVFLIELARTTHFPPLLIFAVGRLVIHAGMALGEVTALLFTGGMTVFFIASIVILVIVAGFMFTDRDMTFYVEPPTSDELVSSFEPQGDLGTRIKAIATEKGLSPRETEVLMLWATGHGSNAIQEKLSVSAATVKTHLRHIYEKCDVHSRAEILELIERL